MERDFIFVTEENGIIMKYFEKGLSAMKKKESRLSVKRPPVGFKEREKLKINYLIII